MKTRSCSNLPKIGRHQCNPSFYPICKYCPFLTLMLKVSHKKSCLICVELRISKYYVMFYSRDLTFSKSGGEIRQRKQQQTLTLNCIFSEGLVDTTTKMWSKIVWVRIQNLLHFKKKFLDRSKAELLLLKLIHLFVREVLLKYVWIFQLWKSSEVKIHSGKLPQIRFQASPRPGGKVAAIAVRYFIWPEPAHIVRWRCFDKL